MSNNSGKNNPQASLGIGLLGGGIILCIIAIAIAAPGIIVFAAIMVFFGLTAIIFSVLNKAKNANNRPGPPYAPPEDNSLYGQPDDNSPYAPPDDSSPYGQSGGYDPYAQNGWGQWQPGRPWQPPAKPENGIPEETQTEQKRRIAEAGRDAQKHYKAPDKDKIKPAAPAVPAAVSKKPEDEEALSGIKRKDEGVPVISDTGLEALEFEAAAERENLAILQGGGAMETARIAKVESVSENYCRVTFALQTFEGTLMKYAVLRKEPKLVPDSAHYILLDKDDKDRCTVL